jgi:hypothetical protein
MVCGSILENENMVVTQLAYLVLNVIKNCANNVIYEIWHIEIMNVHANCIQNTIQRTTELVTYKYSHPQVKNNFSPNQPISGY